MGSIEEARMKKRRMNREENSVPCGSKSASLQMSAILPFLIFAILISFPVRSFAQDDYEKEKAHAIELCDQNKFAEALPILEKLNSVVPKDLVVIEKLATALVASVSTQSDDASRTKTLLRARSLALQAKELGDESNLVKVLLERIPPDGKINEAKLSERKEADEAMKTAESAFARGDFDAAIAGYRRALAADPKLYEAPLFMGDVY